MTTFIRWRWPGVPHYVSGPGVVVGLCMIVMPHIPLLNVVTAASVTAGLALIAFGVEWQLAHRPPPTPAAPLVAGTAKSPDRAWVSIEVGQHSGIQWGPEGARFSVDFILANTGKTPAKNVFFEAKTLLPQMGQPAIPLEAMQGYAEDIRRRRGAGTEAGGVLFAGATQERGMAMLLPRAEAVKLIADSKTLDLLPRVIACVSYSIEDGGAYRHTCRSFYVITTPNPGGPDGTFRGVAVDMDYGTRDVGIADAGYSIAE